MKALFLRLAILVSAWSILGSAAPAKKIIPPVDAWYYWYWSDDDSYFSFHSVVDEEQEISDMTGLIVNTNPAGGTRIANGYINTVMPHNTLPAAILYTH